MDTLRDLAVCDKQQLLACKMRKAERRLKRKCLGFLAARIAQCDKSGILRDCLAQTELKLLIGCRGVDADIGNRREIGNIEDALMRFTVLTDETCAVYAENDMIARDCEIMENLIECAL